MNKSRENPSSIRSKKYLSNALLTLMRKKTFSKITIQEITTEAQLARMTFYSNFNTKEDILKYYTDRLFKDFIDLFDGKEDINLKVLTIEFFMFWQKNSDYVKLLIENDLPIVLNLFDDYIVKFNDIYKMVEFKDDEPFEMLYRSSFFAGGLWNMLLTWIASGMNETPEELAAILPSFIRDVS